MTDMLTLYSKPGCVQCRATEREFKKEGIPYNYVDLSVEPEAIDTIKELGYLAAPVVYIDEDTHWSGHRPDLIERHAVVA